MWSEFFRDKNPFQAQVRSGIFCKKLGDEGSHVVAVEAFDRQGYTASASCGGA